VTPSSGKGAAPTFWAEGGTPPADVGHTVGCRGGAACVCTRLLMGSLGGEQKVGKGRDQGGLGRNKCDKKEG